MANIGKRSSHHSESVPDGLSADADQKSVSGKSNIRGSELGNIVSGVFTPVLAKHSKSFSLIDCISVGVDRMQRNFEPMRKQVEMWQRSELTDVNAKVVIYEAFVEGRLEAPKHLGRTVHDLYFEPTTRSSGREQSGVSPMRSRLHSRNSNQSRNSRRRQSWANFWKPGSHNGSRLKAVSARRPWLEHNNCGSAVGFQGQIAGRSKIDLPQVKISLYREEELAQ
jgi:hypothetical protein